MFSTLVENVREKVEEAKFSKQIKSEGREQRKSLGNTFQQCKSAKVLESEFKNALSESSWFKNISTKKRAGNLFYE
jgi:hypothetical protein